MPAGDLNNFLIKAVAAHAGVDQFSPTTKPTKLQVIAWLNEGIRDMVMRFLPRRLDTGEMTPGRLDKLIRQTYSEAETGAAGFCQLPNTTNVETAGVCHYNLITIGGIPAVEVPLREITDRAAGTTFAVTAANPVYAWGDNGTYNGIYYLPVSATAIVYHFIKLPTALFDYVSAESDEDFPLDDELMVPCQHFASAKLFKAKNEAVAAIIGGLHEKLYEAQMAVYVGKTALIESREGV